MLLLAAIAALGASRRWRMRRNAQVEARWRAALHEVAEDPALTLPPMQLRELPHFLNVWNRLRESADVDTAVRLEQLIVQRGIDRHARGMLASRSLRQRLAAVTAAGHLRDRAAWDRLESLSRQHGPVTSFAAARALLRIDASHALDVLSTSIPARADWPLGRLASVFHELGPSVVTGSLVTMLLRRPRPGLDRVMKLARFGQAAKISGIVRGWLGSGNDPDILMVALSYIEDPADIPWAVGAARHEEWRVRMAAARALGRVGGRDELPALLELLRDSIWWVRYHAAQGLIRLKGLEPFELETLRENARDAFAADMLGQALAERRWS
jgi:HEAT repeat protein